MKKYFLLILMISSVLLSCKPDDIGGNNPNSGGSNNNGGSNDEVVELPTVITSSVTEITETSAVCGGEVTADGGMDVTERGICWGTEQNPTTEGNFLNEGEGVGAFSATLSDLLSNTTYYVRAYATNSVGTAYGEEVCFTTLEEQEESEYAYIDLGLPSGVKWATYNVGATEPEGWGDHFAWGELETKEEYYTNSCYTYEMKLDDISGNPEFDVASAQWGDGWRMPRLQDYYELITECNWTWTTVNGVKGFKVMSKTNGNYIFLPSSGFMNTNAATAAGTEGVLDQGSWGYYWTSTPYDDSGDQGYGVNTHKRAVFFNFSSSAYITDVGLRGNGFTIRPVID